jgi:hypothetical protein
MKSMDVKVQVSDFTQIFDGGGGGGGGGGKKGGKTPTTGRTRGTGAPATRGTGRGGPRELANAARGLRNRPTGGARTLPRAR